MQNLLLEIHDANFMLFGVVIWLNVLMYSIYETSSIALNTIAWSFLRNNEFAVVSANVLWAFDCGSKWVELRWFWSKMSILIDMSMREVTYLGTNYGCGGDEINEQTSLIAMFNTAIGIYKMR